MQSFSSPIPTTASLSAFSTILLVMWEIRFVDQLTDTGVGFDAPLYLLICLMIASHWMTGQRMLSSVLHWVTVSSFCPFFCVTNVMETLLAVLRAETNE